MDKADGILKFGEEIWPQRQKWCFQPTRSYVTSYGQNNPEHSCTGVKIFFLAYGGPKFIRDLEEDLRKELKLEERVRRGRERVFATPTYVCSRIRDIVGPKNRHLSVLTPFKTDADSRNSPMIKPLQPTRIMKRIVHAPRRLRL